MGNIASSATGNAKDTILGVSGDIRQTTQSGISVISKAGDNIRTIITNGQDGVVHVLESFAGDATTVFVDTETNFFKTVQGGITDFRGLITDETALVTSSFDKTVLGVLTTIDSSIDGFKNTADKSITNFFDQAFYLTSWVFVFGSFVVILHGDQLLEIANRLTKPVGNILEKIAQNGGIKIDI